MPVVESDLRALEVEVARVAGIRNAADARLVSLVASALASGAWQGDRILSPEQWLMWRCGLERATAHRVVVVARRSGELPVTMARFAEGRLSLEQVAVVARFAPSSHEESVSRVAMAATVGQIRRATARYGFDAEAAPAPEVETAPAEPASPRLPEPEPARRVGFGSDGREWWAQVRLPVDEGLVVEGVLRAVRDRLRRADPAARLSWADALVGVARSVLARGGAGAERASRAHVLVHLEGRGDGAPGWVGTVGPGGALPDALRRDVTCDAEVQGVRLVNGVPVDVGRRSRAVPERLRRLVLERDGWTCRVPGCDQHLWLEVHHLCHWEDGGRTDMANLAALCPRHHRLHHRGLLGITGDPNAELTVTDAHGRVLDPAGRPRPPNPADVPRVAPYQHPVGERLYDRDVYFAPNRARGPTAA